MAMAYEQRLDSWFLLAAELTEVSPQAPGRSFLLELQRLIGVAGRNLSFRDFLPRYRWMTTLSAEHLEECFEWLARAEQRAGVAEGGEDRSCTPSAGLAVHDAPDALLHVAKAG